MRFSVALAGKGGTGKTTVAGMLVKYLVSKGKQPVLAVDADANANLNEVLGVTVEGTLGRAREDMKKGQVPEGMTKDMFIEMRLEQAVIEAKDFDLLVMGQPEGSGCYCAANSLLARFLERLTGNYAYLVMDNEAGMEHISRLTTRNVSVLLLVTDPSRRSIQAAGRIARLAGELNIGAGETWLIVNQVKNGLSEESAKAVREEGLNLLGIIPEDPAIAEYDMKGAPTLSLPEDTVSVRAAFSLFDKIIR
jgi:CO dehydrogenase maturation factor